MLRSWMPEHPSIRSTDNYRPRSWRPDSADKSSFTWLWRRHPDRVVRRSSGPLLPIFPVREPDHEDIEDRQSQEPDGEGESHPIDLIDDQYDQKSNHPWVGPDLVPEQRRHQPDLDYAV